MLKWLSLIGVFVGMNLIVLGVAHIQSAAMNPGYEPLIDICLLVGGFVLGSFSYVVHRYYKSATEQHNQLELEVNALLHAHKDTQPKDPQHKN